MVGCGVDKRVLVGVSGGVDSAVALYMVLSMGYRVDASFMINWHAADGDKFCSMPQDLRDARLVCDQMGLVLHQVDFSEEYWQRVFNYCLDQFAMGNTPNPDVLCNSEIKFQVFWHYAKEHFGAELIATGHYARKVHIDGQWRLLKGVDESKDQSYFLHRLSYDQLSRAMFPLGELTKLAVRAKAKELALPVWNKPDSTGICFIGERKFGDFLREYLLTRPGKIVDKTGKILGEHHGIYFYTLGQRNGLGIGGLAGRQELPWYVMTKNLSDNILVVTQQREDLLHRTLYASKIHWINHDVELPMNCQAKIRYRQTDQQCWVEQNGDRLMVSFSEPQWAITPGQSVVFYQGVRCLGGAIIESYCH